MKKPDTCQTCPLFDAPGPVWGEGPKDAQMLFVGEAPGEDEGYTLRPFVGGSGRVLNAQLAQAGIDRKKIFVTNVVKCRPTAKGADGRVINRQPTELEIRTCARFLAGELDEVKPNLIVGLGNIPLHTLTPYTKKGVTVMRSVPLEGPRRKDDKAERYKSIFTIHPAAIMRSQALWPLVIFDLVRARNESASPIITRRAWKNVIHAKLSDVGERLERVIRDGSRYGGLRPYFHDLETTGLDARRSAIRCIGIAGSPEEVFTFDWTDDVQRFTARLHADPTLLTVGQNSEGFDIPYQEEKGFEFKGPTYDTLIGFHQLNADLPKDLGSIGASVTDEPYWKDDSMYKSGEDALQKGCGKDIHATARAFEDQLLEMDSIPGQRDLYFNHIMPVQPVLRRMTKRGMKKDMRTAVAWHKVLNKKADELEARLKKGLGDSTFNVDSPKQLADLLYTRMGLPPQYKQTREGFRISVDADALEDLANKVKNPILLLVRDIRTLRKWDSTFVMCEHDDNNVVHGHFSTAKAANGRLNSYNPNMQNFPAEVREIFVPDTPEHIFISRDWSQIEWKIAMALAGDKNGLDALASGRDAHKDAWAHAFGVPYDEVTKKMRFDAKTINYGVLYGRGAKSLAEGKSGGRSGASRSKADTAMSEQMVLDYLPRFFAKFSGFDAFRKDIERQVKRNNFLSSPWGRRRYWYSSQNMPEAYNFPISSAAASMMYEAIVELEAQLPSGADLRLTVHDELVIHSVKEQKILQEALDVSAAVMEKFFPQITEASLYPDVVRHYYPQGWSCSTEANIGTNWRMLKGERKVDIEAETELLKTLGVRKTAA